MITEANAHYLEILYHFVFVTTLILCLISAIMGTISYMIPIFIYFAYDGINAVRSFLLVFLAKNQLIRKKGLCLIAESVFSALVKIMLIIQQQTSNYSLYYAMLPIITLACLRVKIAIIDVNDDNLTIFANWVRIYLILIMDIPKIIYYFFSF